ncbi:MULTISPECIES: glycosyltransferase [Streptomyces]|nr:MULTISPECIES: glycosyltransferase [Streptomyces]
MGHEEAVYANKARSWLDGSPDAGWGIYRPVGLPFLGAIALAIHHDVGALRAVALLLSLFTLLTIYVVCSCWSTPRRAVVTTVVILSGLGFLRRMPEFLNDIGATGLLLIFVFLLARAQEKPKSRALLAAPFIALAAFYLRYGIVGNLLAISVAAAFSYGIRSWIAQGWRMAIAVVVLLAGLVPHFVYAAKVSGWPLGIVLSATSQANRSYVGDGLVYYLAIFPYRLAGDLGAVIMICGLFTAGAATKLLIRKRASSSNGPSIEDRRRVFLGATAVLIFVILGLATDGEPRFVFLSVVLLSFLGVQRLADISKQLADIPLTFTAAVSLLTILGTSQVVAYGAIPGPTKLSESTVPVAQQMSSADPCLLVSGYEPEMGWYSGCDAVTYAQYREMASRSDVRVSLVLFERGRLQPGPASLSALIDGRDTTIVRIPTKGSLGTATVITLSE